MMDRDHRRQPISVQPQLRKDAIAEAATLPHYHHLLSTASSELEGTRRALSDNAGNTTRLATVVPMPEDAQQCSVGWRRHEELAIWCADFAEGSGIQLDPASAVRQADETDSRINALSQAATGSAMYQN